MEEENDEGLRRRLARGGEDALGKLAQDLLENPLVTSAIARAFEAREKAAAAQTAALGALNIPSAADIERLTRRVRSVSQRLEGIEDGVEQLGERLAGASGATPLEARLAAIDARLEAIERGVGALGSARTHDRRLKEIGSELEALRAAAGDDRRLAAVEDALRAVGRELAAVRRDLPGAPEPVAPGQERLEVAAGES